MLRYSVLPVLPVFVKLSQAHPVQFFTARELTGCACSLNNWCSAAAVTVCIHVCYNAYLFHAHNTGIWHRGFAL